MAFCLTPFKHLATTLLNPPKHTILILGTKIVSVGVMEMDAALYHGSSSEGRKRRKISKQLTRIIEQVQALSPSFEGVNESMQIQSGNAQQINNSMVNLSEEMQQTVQFLRESFLAIEQLNSAAKGLQDEMSRFRVVM